MATVGNWLLFAGYLFLVVKAYSYLRDRHGTSDGSWLEGIGGLYIAPILAPFLPIIWIYQWTGQRQEARQIRAGGGPLTLAQRTERRSLYTGGLVVLLGVCVVGYLLLCTRLSG